MKNNLSYLILKSVIGIPFYHSMLKYFPKFFIRFLIKISKFYNIESYIFHARDFTKANLKKTILIFSFLNQNYFLTSVRDFY